MWTTRRLREMEQATLQIADRSLDRNPAPVAERFLKQARREIIKEIHGPLSVEQREALDVITGPGGVSVLVGRAGTGKGVVLSAAARAWQLEDREVIGTAIAGGPRAAPPRGRRPRPLLHHRCPDQRRRERPHPSELAKRRDHGRGRDGRHRTALPVDGGDRPRRRHARPRRRLRTARLDRRRRHVRAAPRAGPHRRTDRGAPRQPRVGAEGVGAGTRRPTGSGARGLPRPRSPAHPRHPRRGGGGDGSKSGTAAGTRAPAAR